MIDNMKKAFLDDDDFKFDNFNLKDFPSGSFENNLDEQFHKDFPSAHFDKDKFDKEFEAAREYHEHFHGNVMRGLSIGAAVAIAIGFCILLYCCRRRRNRGRVLTPPSVAAVVIHQPAPPAAHSAAPYPRQQYVTATMPMPGANTTMYSAAPYPVAGGAPPYPVAGGVPPYPMAGATPYPGGAAPYPVMGNPPYPQTDTAFQPSAPDLHTLPPTYEQATSQNIKHA